MKEAMRDEHIWRGRRGEGEFFRQQEVIGPSSKWKSKAAGLGWLRPAPSTDKATLLPCITQNKVHFSKMTLNFLVCWS